jgi:hypothetical protein
VTWKLTEGSCITWCPSSAQQRQWQIWTGHRLGEKATGDLQTPMQKYYRSSQPLANAGSRRIGGQFATAVIFMPLTRTAATLD